MIIDARTLPALHHLEADLCIVGAGAAGITLARELTGSGLSVILAEGGAEDGGESLSPFHGDVVDPRHAPLDLYRCRGLGGTTSLWGGRCLPFDSVDFEQRPWVPHSGWPFGRRDLDPYYRRAMEYCDAGEFVWWSHQALADPPPQMIPGFSDPDLVTEYIERFSLPTHFGRRHRAALAKAPDVTVLLNANCTRVGLSAFGNRAEVLHFASRPGHMFSVSAHGYVLATGGLETTRLLLISDDVLSEGVGNAYGLVGRYYQCHIEGKMGLLRLRPDIKGVIHGYERDPLGVYCRRRLWVSEEAQRRLGLMNFVARCEHPAIADPAHRSGILSAMWLSQTFLKKEYGRKIATFGLNGGGEGGGGAAGLARLAGHLRNVVVDSRTLLPFALHWVRNRRFSERQLPYVTIPNRDNVFHLDYNAEQSPNPESRVTLSPERDAFGRRRLKVDWRTTAQDHDNVAACYRLMRDRLRAAGIGDLDFDEDRLRGEFNAIGGHHIGTTRMARHPSQGVVDPEGRVFGVDNLYISSAATFPTGGYANPTLTIVAMACRLAEHLREALRRPQSDPILMVQMPRSLGAGSPQGGTP